MTPLVNKQGVSVSMYSFAPLTGDDKSAKTSSDRQTYYLKCAAKVAEKSTMEHKHGAIIVHDNEIIATGFNHVYEHMCHKNSMHAEVDALLKVRTRGKHVLNDSEMYVVRLGSRTFKHLLKYSKPCCDCQKAIHKYGIRKVFYSTNNDYNSILESLNNSHSE